MSGFSEISTVPLGFTRLPTQRVAAGNNEKTSSTKQDMSVLASIDGLAVEIVNTRSALGQALDVDVTHFVLKNPGSRFGTNKTIIARKNFAQGQSMMFLDTSHVDSTQKQAIYFYRFSLEVSIGVDVFGNDLGVDVNLFQAPIPLRKPEQRPPRKLEVPPGKKLSNTTEITHVVKRGEFLTLIAKLHYNDGSKWKIIFDANRAVIGPNPNLIKPGQKLVIPQL